MEKRKHLSGSAGDRYVEVAPPGSSVALSPYTHYDQEPGRATIGEYSRVVLQVADVRRAHEVLTAQGVDLEIVGPRPSQARRGSRLRRRPRVTWPGSRSSAEP
jgi:hypothetical protein